MTYDLGAPTIVKACPLDGCDRKVGPYFEQRYADEAMENHLHWRHENFQLAAPVD